MMNSFLRLLVMLAGLGSLVFASVVMMTMSEKGEIHHGTFWFLGAGFCLMVVSLVFGSSFTRRDQEDDGD
jgi:hypothetical protein